VGRGLVGAEVGEIPHLEIVALDGRDVVEARSLAFKEADAFLREPGIHPVGRVGRAFAGGGVDGPFAPQVAQQTLGTVEAMPCLGALAVQLVQLPARKVLVVAIGADLDPAFALDLVLGGVRIHLPQAELPDRLVGHDVLAVSHVAVGAGRRQVVALSQRLAPVGRRGVGEVALAVRRAVKSLVVRVRRAAVAGGAGLGAARFGGLEAVAGVAGIALGRHRVALHAGRGFRLGLVGEMLAVGGALHGQHVAGEAVLLFGLEGVVLHGVAFGAYLGRRHAQLLVVGAMAIRTGHRRAIRRLAVAAVAPVGDDARRQRFVAGDAFRGGENAFDANDRLVETVGVPVALHRVGLPLARIQAAAGAALAPVDPDHAQCDAGQRQQHRDQQPAPGHQRSRRWRATARAMPMPASSRKGSSVRPGIVSFVVQKKSKLTE
jgi:hypothetical protein